MKLTSPAFTDNGMMPEQYSHDGGNVSPPLAFADVPSGTKSLALVCHDPDAPRADGFTHWVVWNIPADANGCNENEVPHGAVQGMADWGDRAWGGPKPPSGTHHYNFTLYALDTMLDLPPLASRMELEQAMNGHVLDHAMLTGLYSAPQ